jgi:hypothetical protein
MSNASSAKMNRFSHAWQIRRAETLYERPSYGVDYSPWIKGLAIYKIADVRRTDFLLSNGSATAFRPLTLCRDLGPGYSLSRHRVFESPYKVTQCPELDLESLTEAKTL